MYVLPVMRLGMVWGVRRPCILLELRFIHIWRLWEMPEVCSFQSCGIASSRNMDNLATQLCFNKFNAVCYLHFLSPFSPRTYEFFFFFFEEFIFCAYFCSNTHSWWHEDTYAWSSMESLYTNESTKVCHKVASLNWRVERALTSNKNLEE